MLLFLTCLPVTSMRASGSPDRNLARLRKVAKVAGYINSKRILSFSVSFLGLKPRTFLYHGFHRGLYCNPRFPTACSLSVSSSRYLILTIFTLVFPRPSILPCSCRYFAAPGRSQPECTRSWVEFRWVLQVRLPFFKQVTTPFTSITVMLPLLVAPSSKLPL